eukprot:2656357-Rhodomonas_salina.1
MSKAAKPERKPPSSSPPNFNLSAWLESRAAAWPAWAGTGTTDSLYNEALLLVNRLLEGEPTSREAPTITASSDLMDLR